MTDVELTIDALAATGPGIGRDAAGRVTFVPRTAPGDRVRARVVSATKTFAHAELVELLAPGAARVEAVCPHVREGCGGCQWQEVAYPAQLAAKQDIVARALRKLAGLRIHEIRAPAPPLGWRRRARFHVERGRVGLYREQSHALVAIDACPQLEPALDAALRTVIAARPPDGELALLLAHDGRVVIATERAWPAAPFRDEVVEIDPGIRGDALAFAQASAAGNRALVAAAVELLGNGPGTLLELHAGAGNFTRAFAAAGWTVTPSDLRAPAAPPPRFRTGAADEILRRAPRGWDAIALDPPRTGAAECVAGILAHAPRVVVYVSCDPATLARDAERLVAGGYRATDAVPLDVMPQTAHIEVVLRLERA
ncbi:MAG TPA: TRAM domain-containing protein [Kofleriaceae bacterium]